MIELFCINDLSTQTYLNKLLEHLIIGKSQSTVLDT